MICAIREHVQFNSIEMVKLCWNVSSSTTRTHTHAVHINYVVWKRIRRWSLCNCKPDRQKANDEKQV